MTAGGGAERWPWRAAAATAVGSYPGTSVIEAARILVGELPDLIHVPELPARGPGADMVGRTAALLSSVSSDLAVETTPQGWRFAMAPGRDMRRAQSFLNEDLDALEEAALGYRGPVKCQVVGPWTLAAAIELRTGERALRDPSAVTDVAEALGEALRLHLADLRRRLPGASTIIVQLDEPSLPAVLEGRIGTASGLSSYRAVDEQDAERALRRPMDAAREAGALPGVHCCHPDVPLDLLRRSGAEVVSVDLTVLGHGQDEALGRAWESGTGVLAGCVPSVGDDALGATRASAPLRELLHRLGLEDPRWLDQVVVTPTCGLAGASPQWVRMALAACADVGRVVRDDGQNEEQSDDRGGRR